MPLFNTLPIMPKESKTPVPTYVSGYTPYPISGTTGPRIAAIWSSTDDQTLLSARASGMSWHPIATKYFPNKTPNACRKRYERLVERRNVEDWDSQKLELLASEYMAVRKEMWEILASRLGERWQVVEAKCMEKGIKTLQANARTAQRRANSGQSDSFDDQGITDHHSDSGIGLGSDAEMEVDEPGPPRADSRKPSSWHAHTGAQSTHQEHSRTRSLPQHLSGQPPPRDNLSRNLPQPLPLYQPPPPITTQTRTFDAPMTTSPATMSFVRSTAAQRFSPDSHNSRRSISIQSVLSPADPQCV